MVQRERTRSTPPAAPGWSEWAEAADGPVRGEWTDTPRELCLRPARQRAAKYRPARVTAQFATTLCAANVPMSRLIQNRVMRTRSIGTLSSAHSADTEM